MRKFVDSNRTHWDERAKIHERPSAYYDVDTVKAGGLSLRVVEPYFHDGPTRYEGGTDYAVRDAAVATESYEWSHTLGDVVTALATAGLRIAFVHEFPFCDWEYLQGMQRGTDGYYRLANDAICIPQIYSIKATR